MATTNGKPGRFAAALAIVLLSLTSGRLAADDAAKKGAADGDKDLRKRALALNDITGTDPVKGEITTLVKDAAGTKKLLAVAAKMAKEKDQPFNLNATFILASSAAMLKEVDTAQQFYRLNLDQAIKMGSGSKIGQAVRGLVALLLINKKYAECEKICKEFLDLDVENDESVDNLKRSVLHWLILAMARQEHYDKAYELLDKIIKAEPDYWPHIELKAELLREEGKNEDSAKLFEELIEKVKDDKRIKESARDQFVGDCRYQLSGIYIDLNQVDKAAGHLEALLKKEPDNPTYNNDLGYIWADHDKNLAESEKLIRKALEEDRKQRRKNDPDLKADEDKDNAAFLDSLGWVLFKQKKFQEAKDPLLKAVKEPEGKHIEIYDHLAEVYLALGDKKEAVATWKKGIESAGKSAREQQRKAAVEKKLKANE